MEKEIVLTSYRLFRHDTSFPMHLGGSLAGFQLAYETWGELSPRADNAILLTTGLSPSSHAKSHPGAPHPGWWEEFIGPGLALDTDTYFVVCSNVLGGCYGSTGPSSIDPATGRPYALSFPSVTIEDMVRAQKLLLRQLGIERLYAAIGSSMGGMQSLAHSALFPDTVARVIAISVAGRSYPWSIAIRFVQRQAVLADPDWHGGNYYGQRGPLNGLHLARQLGTISYRGPGEWTPRFGRQRVGGARTASVGGTGGRASQANPGPGVDSGAASAPGNPAMSPGGGAGPASTAGDPTTRLGPGAPERGSAEPSFPDRPGVEAARAHNFGVDFQIESYLAHQGDKFVHAYDTNSYLYISKAMDLFDLGDGQPSYEDGLARVDGRTLIVGVPSDLLFPMRLQQEIADILMSRGRDCTFAMLDSVYGHDSFLVEVDKLTAILKPFLAR